MLISVIIPVFNVEKFVEEAILSICNQTYKNLEIIVIDDCSTDNTFFLIEQIAKKDKRIKLYRNEYNLKLVATLNKALQYVTGQYVVRMDGDDISLPNRIEKMYHFLENNPDYILVGSQVITINEQGNEIGKPKLPNNFEVIRKICLNASPILHIWMCKTVLYKKLNGYRDILGAEDYDFILRVLSYGYKITNLNEHLYLVRIREGNTISTIGLKQHISHKYCTYLYKERLNNNNIDSYNYDFLINKFNLIATEDNQNKFIIHSQYFKKGFMMLKSYNILGLYYISLVFIKSRYIRFYLINRIIYKLKILGSN